MRIAVVGATGLVGSTIIKILEERDFPVTELIPVASERSVGKRVLFKDGQYEIVTPERAVEMRPQIALFSAGSEVSRVWAPVFAQMGCRVVDNSSYWRMDSSKKLIIPEVNGSALQKSDMIIANPNCSTIQMLVALAPLHREYEIERIVVSTYQSVTGTGQRAIAQLEGERIGSVHDKIYPYPIDLNLIPQIDSFLDNGYTKEEMKMVNETHKILNDYSIAVSATTVRVPVMGGHSESVNVVFKKSFSMDDVRFHLENAPGVVICDDPDKAVYPMPLYAFGKDEVFVGRLRKDLYEERGLNCWIVADNLRKGAATNAVQIAELLI